MMLTGYVYYFSMALKHVKFRAVVWLIIISVLVLKGGPQKSHYCLRGLAGSH
jgi:hypothetical protein